MNKLSIECIKADISTLDHKIIKLNKELSKLHNAKKKLEIKLIAMDTRTEDERLRDLYIIDYCFGQIKNEELLWDLRYWNHLKHRPEVETWIEYIIDYNTGDKNCGHTEFCIYILLEIHKVDKDKVVDAVMENNKVSYRDNQGELV